MPHEIFGLPSASHEALAVVLVDSALVFLIPAILIAFLLWRDKRRGLKKPQHQTPRPRTRTHKRRRR
jgi:hypothetical protein